MKTFETPPSVPEARLRAKRLLKQLRSASADAALAAAARFRQLRSYADQTIEEIVERSDRVQLKHALTVLAVEHEQESWPALKASIEARSASPEQQAVRGREMYVPAQDVLLNRWFARYDEARESLEKRGGFLLPFDRQFFICEEEGIRVLGLDPDDSDWHRIGWDWVEPSDPKAWQRLRDQRREVLRAER